MADLAQLAGSGMVKGMAVTGSDPYFVTGTDLAILFETDQPGKLIILLRERLEAACHLGRRYRADREHKGRLEVCRRTNSGTGDQLIHRRA